jgi:hypothetical protein
MSLLRTCCHVLLAGCMPWVLEHELLESRSLHHSSVMDLLRRFKHAAAVKQRGMAVSRPLLHTAFLLAACYDRHKHLLFVVLLIRFCKTSSATIVNSTPLALSYCRN